jgi:hypothetical protein
MQWECRTALLQVAPVGVSEPATLRPDRGRGQCSPESGEELENLKEFRHDLEEREPLEKRNISRN